MDSENRLCLRSADPPQEKEVSVMPFIMAQEDSAYKCAGCGHLMQLTKGQLVPPCPRCGGTMEKHEGPAPAAERPGCG